MDILISSNVERVLFDKYGPKRTKELMDELKENKFYKLSSNELKELQKDFSAVYSDDDFARETIKEFANDGYIMDPHTATCLKAYTELKEKNIPSILCSTAEWTKFAPTMLNALKKDTIKYSDKEALKGISESLHVKIPQCISSLFEKKVLHDKVVNRKDIENEILNFIKEK
jgi:threonine synthase